MIGEALAEQTKTIDDMLKSAGSCVNDVTELSECIPVKSIVFNSVPSTSQPSGKPGSDSEPEKSDDEGDSFENDLHSDLSNLLKDYKEWTLEVLGDDCFVIRRGAHEIPDKTSQPEPKAPKVAPKPPKVHRTPPPSVKRSSGTILSFENWIGKTIEYTSKYNLPDDFGSMSLKEAKNTF